MMSMYVLDVAKVNKDASSRSRGGQQPLPSVAELTAVLGLARKMFPRDHVFAICNASTVAIEHGYEVVKEATKDAGWRPWFRLSPIDDARIEAQPVNLESVKACGIDAPHSHPPLEAWRDAQRWSAESVVSGLEDVPTASFAISSLLQIGTDVRVYVVRSATAAANDVAFTDAEVQQFAVDVGFYDPDAWRHAFIHRAIEVLRLPRTGSSGNLEPAKMSAILALTNGQEKAMAGHEAFDALRDRWYSEIVAYAKGLARAGEIRMSDEEIEDYIGVGACRNFDNFFAEGTAPDDSLEEDRTYWD